MTVSTSLPVYRREAPAFEDTFGVPASAVRRAMDLAGDDLVAQAPRVPLELARVGYQRDRIVVQVDDPFGSGAQAPFVCSVTIATGVPARRRGVHVSRLGHVLAESVQRSYPNLSSYASELASAVSRSQYGEPTTIAVRGSMPYLEEVPSEEERASKSSLEHLHLIARAHLPERTAAMAPRISVGLKIVHLVACPCVQQMEKHARQIASGLGLAVAPAGPEPTHSQRCSTTVLACGITRPFRVPELLARLDRVLFRTRGTLPRGEELALVHRAHQSPQFIEDALREALWALATTLGDPSSFARLVGRSRSAESIHEFDLSAAAVLSPSDLLHVAQDLAG